MAIATAAQLTQITNLYVSLFNRAPDTAGLSFWSSALANGANIQAITRGFLTAPEGQANYPQFQSASEFVTAFYTKVFGRAPDAGGLAFWTAALNGAGGANSDAAKATVVSQIVSIVSTPLTARPDGLTDAQYAQTVNDRALFANKVEVGTYVASQTTVTVDQAKVILYTNAVPPVAIVTADPATVITAKQTANVFGATLTAAVAATNGAAVVGSASADFFTLTGGDIGTVETKSAFSLDGGAGVDTLAITGGVTILTGAVKNVTNIENITFNATSTVNVAKFVGATTFANLGGNLTLTDLAAGQGVAVNAAGTTSATYLAAATAAALNVSGGTTSGVAATGTSSGTVAFVGTGLTSAAITSTGNVANTTGPITLAGTIGAVSINATTGLTTSFAAGVKTGAALTVTGGGAVNLTGVLASGFTTVNAGAATGGLTANIGTTVTSLTGSTAVDKITVSGALAAGTTINLGAGNDQLLFANGGAIAAGSTIDAGAGTDTLSASLVTSANATVFKNFELLQIDAGSITDASLLTGSTLTGLVLASGAAGGAVNNVASTLGLTVTGVVDSGAAAGAGVGVGTTTIGVTNSATNTADVYTITLANATANAAVNAGTIGLANIETINIVSAGTVGTGNSNTVQISDAALKTLNITGSQAATVSFSTATTATSLIDGSAATGSLTINTANLVAATAANGGLTIKGGTAADSLTLSQVATVTGGAGNDYFNVAGTAIVGSNAGAFVAADLTTKLVTITDFARGDAIDFIGTGSTLVAGVKIEVTDLSASANLLAAANTAVGTTNTAGTAATIEAFRFGGDTYIVADIGGANAGSIGVGDAIVKLAGVVDLSSAVVLATGEVYFAAAA